MNVDFTSDAPLDDTSGLAVSFVKPNDVKTEPMDVTSPMMTSLAEPMPTVTSNGKKRKSSSDTPLPIQTSLMPNTSVKAEVETPAAIVDESVNSGPNSDEP